MRIAYILDQYPMVTRTFIQREVEALRHHGAKVYPFSVRSPRFAPSMGESNDKEKERTTYLLPPHPLKVLAAHWHLLINRPGQYFQALKLTWQTRQAGARGALLQMVYFVEAGLLTHQLQQQDIRHLHNHFGSSSGTVAMLASVLGDFGYSFTLHGPGIFSEARRWRLDEKIRRAKFVVCISHFCRSQTMMIAPLETWPKLHIVHCGVDPAQFQGLHQAKKTSLEASKKTLVQPSVRLLYVGRLAAAKGLPILIDSLSNLKDSYPQIHLTVVGDGPERSAIEARVMSLGLADNVDFVGYQSPEAVRDYLQVADVFVMSSFAEGVPVVLMEAMMTGIPVIATRIAGISELVDDGLNGFLVSPGDAEDLSDHIRTLIKDTLLRQRFGRQGQRKVRQEFNIYLEAQKLFQLMEKVSA